MNEYLKNRINFYNESEGDLNLTDGIECKLCKNKGFIAILENNSEYVKECSCMSKRKNYQRLLNSGISLEMINNFSFDNYSQKENWQRQVFGAFKEFVIDFDRGKRYWLYFSGITGAGKTHLCTALFKELISKGYSGHYIKWVKDINKILKLKYSFDKQDQYEYEKIMNYISEVDVLYIDDFMKFTETDRNALTEALKIIELRIYSNKVTIFSSELSLNGLEKIDMATAGRIYEKANDGYYIINCGNDTNKNYRCKK